MATSTNRISFVSHNFFFFNSDALVRAMAVVSGGYQGAMRALSPPTPPPALPRLVYQLSSSCTSWSLLAAACPSHRPALWAEAKGEKAHLQTSAYIPSEELPAFSGVCAGGGLWNSPLGPRWFSIMHHDDIYCGVFLDILLAATFLTDYYYHFVSHLLTRVTHLYVSTFFG